MLRTSILRLLPRSIGTEITLLIAALYGERDRWGVIIMRPTLRASVVCCTAMLTSACDFSNAQDRNLAQERACGNQAARVFEKEWLRPATSISPEWESHYNSKLNRCLILITGMWSITKETPDNYQSGWVVDADTRHIFALYYGRYPLK